MRSVHPSSSASTATTVIPSKSIMQTAKPADLLEEKTMSTQRISPVSDTQVSDVQDDPSSFVILMQEEDTITVLESKKSIIMASNVRDLENDLSYKKLIVDVRETGVLDVLILIQLGFAFFLILSSMSLAVAGSSKASAIFLSGVLLLIPIIPVLACLAVGSNQVFKCLLHISAFINLFWAIVSWMGNSSAFPRNLLLFFIAGLQYTTLLILSFDEAAEKREHEKRKATNSMLNDS